MIRWGIVSTIKAPPDDVLDFVAYHLDIGAHRAFLYLDAPDEVPGLADRLRAHPKVRVFETDAAWWAARNGRPAKHQMRQQRNGQHAYRKAGALDWLAHIDVDEFLCPARPIPELLAGVGPEITTARVQPVEALVGAPGLFKAFHHAHPARQRAAARLYPTYGAHLPGGFLSHIVGKAFIRTGLEGVKIRIHGIKQGDRLNPDDQRLSDIELAHFHAASWESWRAHFDYRLDRGSYRPDLPGGAGMNRHALFAAILEARGEAGLRHFFDEVVAGTPDHIARLEAEGLLRRHDLALAARRARHFPDP
jgi:hypothetical protein